MADDGLRRAGYLLKKPDYPFAPLVLAIVSGDKAEDAFRQSMLMSQGSLKIFVDNALVTTLVGMGFVVLLVPPLLRVIRLWRSTSRDI